jgi:hypothetical protein
MLSAKVLFKQVTVAQPGAGIGLGLDIEMCTEKYSQSAQYKQQSGCRSKT